nr:4-hydroxy-tetrahydrodipicolinate synthase-like [Nerophis lumbriciformis]
MSDWQGVYPAVTTQFTTDQKVDLPATSRHVEALAEAGVDGIVMLGTLGEGTSLSFEEKLAVLEATRDVCAGRLPVLSCVAEYTTAGACQMAEAAEGLGLDGLMVLPAMVYKSDVRETLTHFRTVARASGLPVMVYNNPVSYGVDITPEMFGELAEEPTLVAIKESSDDVRRITDIINVCGDRFQLFCGVDDLALEAIVMGAVGWVAGLVNAFPHETVAIWRLSQAGELGRAREIYRWFAPALHLDTDIKLVQYIKLAVQECGLGNEAVRAPRLTLAGEERDRVLAVIRQAIASRPTLGSATYPKEQYDSAYEGGENRAEQAGWENAEVTQQEAAEEGTGNADYDVAEQAEAQPFHDLTGEKAGNRADDQNTRECPSGSPCWLLRASPRTAT